MEPPNLSWLSAHMNAQECADEEAIIDIRLLHDGVTLTSNDRMKTAGFPPSTDSPALKEEVSGS